MHRPGGLQVGEAQFLSRRAAQGIVARQLRGQFGLTTSQLAQTPSSTTQVLTTLLGAVAAVSLLVGVVIATAASYGGSLLMSVPYVFDPTINLLSLLFSAAIGVLFGYVPARRAARLDPIEALRHE